MRNWAPLGYKHELFGDSHQKLLLDFATEALPEWGSSCDGTLAHLWKFQNHVILRISCQALTLPSSQDNCLAPQRVGHSGQDSGLARQGRAI